ncbi:FAD-dependent oxidoreductase [Corallococcus exiguus]|uniref:NAD(P)/FAD-dependent oxidoreductase n=1 Tax=Corallococcus exiguus TaxID=83462 RepID=UPI0014716A16|nr:FAD-dependent oxidoreductase [Corallococcus exiguus]NNB93986.1 FAD-dependent oxidoreductase [Corallococcus exiguus]NNC05019.1 FAD-dependent oxidoreductase [Corallococcus exiguus]
MAYRVNNIGLWLDEPEELLGQRAAEKLGVTRSDLASVRVVRSVLDARKKGSPRYIYTLEVELAPGGKAPRLPPDVSEAPPAPETPARVKEPEKLPLIIGTGPAGLFCALGLLERGVRSILLERGKEVVTRRKDVAKLMRDGSLDRESNMNFGEGGAGAYTDGKLSTRINHPMVRKVIEAFAKYGAPDQILIEGKPHIGSDLLPGAVAKLRDELIAGGCQVHFEQRVDDLLYRDGRIAGVKMADGRTLESDRVILAPGNSARELYERFAADGRVSVEAKPFALGFRAEHPQSLINGIQYGSAAKHSKLPPADYKLAENLDVDGEVRGVYSFCMCPGGIVVPTPTEEGLQCTNGMSNSRRNAKFANAGIVVSVSVADFAREGFHGPLAGLEFQRHWESEAYKLGGGRFFAPAQTIPDYLAGRVKKDPGDTSYRPGLAHTDLNKLFPERLTQSLKAALRTFDRKMKGFISDEGKLIGIESRTSSPVRITRGDDLQSVSMRGLYPVGEGCGYAGGIVSSAIDGLRAAEQIATELA